MFSRTHPDGRNKACVFHARLGLQAKDAMWFRGELLEIAKRRCNEFTMTSTNAFGRLYRLDFELQTNGSKATVRTGWIIRTGERTLQFVTAFVRLWKVVH